MREDWQKCSLIRVDWQWSWFAGEVRSCAFPNWFRNRRNSIRTCRSSIRTRRNSMRTRRFPVFSTFQSSTQTLDLQPLFVQNHFTQWLSSPPSPKLLHKRHQFNSPEKSPTVEKHITRSNEWKLLVVPPPYRTRNVNASELLKWRLICLLISGLLLLQLQQQNH
jgi:hypothetical protein